MTEPTSLKQSLEKAQLGPMERKPADAGPQNLISVARRLLSQQQERLINERASYEAERTTRSNWYRTEMAKLADGAEAEMATLDKGWTKLEAEISTIIRQIKALLSAG